jgi:hypothetical protein
MFVHVFPTSEGTLSFHAGAIAVWDQHEDWGMDVPVILFSSEISYTFTNVRLD